ncbi:hypothetical protein [Crateriforma conspicua]|uniref:hypothetical protein n=1 Tax=Crateriforma conspicua TaxID=2527996 RepID=UPI001188C0E5|nr:hypothetical protein [Crateriforma conspicua]QDV63462.1 hypothetical protein Mal65_26050 [Crateriforma conspicua]
MMEKIIMHLFGYGVFVALMVTMSKAHARRWNRLAAKYRANQRPTNATTPVFSKRTMQTVFLTGRDIGWNSYKGIVTVSVGDEGIMLSLMPPFSLFHPPLQLLYRDIRMEPTRWGLISNCWRYTVTGVHDVQIVMYDELHEWIQNQAAALVPAATV